MRFAAIDIGSNAARLLIKEVKQTRSGPVFIKLNLVRVPLRLGFDVFATGRISREKRTMLFHMMRAFSALLDLYKVDAVKAYATSAMRNAKNSQRIIREIKQKIGINIEVITGSKEADLLCQIHAAEKINKKKTYLYVNVGGGSTELSLFSKGKTSEELSFEIGTIRLLKKKVKKSQWEALKGKLIELSKKNRPDAIIGTGGNINKIFSLTNLSEGKPLSYTLLKSYQQKLSRLTTEERIKKFKLNPDRADVVVPALDIYLSVMKWSKVKTMYVPKVGLVDGIIYLLYTEHKNKG